jgi:hypothetical protein
VFEHWPASLTCLNGRITDSAFAAYRDHPQVAKEPCFSEASKRCPQADRRRRSPLSSRDFDDLQGTEKGLVGLAGQAALEYFVSAGT